MDFIKAIEKALEILATIDFLPLQPGDVPQTYANIDDLINHVGVKPEALIEEGIGKFFNWYRSYYQKYQSVVNFSY